METIRIEITGDPKQVQSTIDQLEKVGKVDKKNADQFKKHHKDEEEAQQKSKKLLEEQIGIINNLEHRIKQLTEIRNKSFDPKVIQRANKALEDAEKQHHKLITASQKHLDFNTKLSHSIKDIGQGIIAAFAVERIIDKVVELGQESIKAFEDAQLATNELRFAVTNLAGGSEGSFKELEEQSEKLSKSLNTLFTPKQIQQAQTQLLTMKLTVEQTTQLMPRMIDIAAKKGWTLDRVAEVFGRAISEGTAKPLTDLGLKFHDTGNMVGNFNKVMESSAKFIGGASDAMNDLANQEREAANKAELLQEKLGSKLAPAWVTIKNGILGAIESEVEFFGTMKDALMGKDVNWTDLAKEYVNALTLGLTGLETSTEELEKYQRKVSTLKKEQIREEVANQIALRNAGKITTQEYLQHMRILSESGNKTFEEEEMREVDLTKLTSDELEKRLELANKQDISIGKFTTSGFQKEAARIEKEINARKKANDELKKLWEKYYADLESIKRKDADDAAKLAIELIDDEEKKKKAQQDEAFRKQMQDMEDRQKKLNEINAKGNKEQRNQALIELQNLYKDMELATTVHEHEIDKIEKEFAKKRAEEKLKKDEEENDLVLKYAKVNSKRRLAEGKISQEEYDREIKQLEIKALEEKLEIERKAGIEYLALQKEIEEKKLDLLIKGGDKTKKILEGFHEITTTIFESLTEHINASISALDTQMEHTNKMIDVQKALAEKGLKNEVAFEERRSDELMKKKLEEQKKLRRVKELETFLNSLARFAEDNPKTALARALGVLAASKAAEAVFLEEGGIAGHAAIKTQIGLAGFARRHKSGRDVLAQLDPKEGVIPANKMSEWGLNTPAQFKNFLQTPFSEKLISGKLVMVNNNTELLNEIRDLKDVIKSRPVTSWDIDKLGNLIESRIKDGMRTVTTHKRNFI